MAKVFPDMTFSIKPKIDIQTARLCADVLNLFLHDKADEWTVIVHGEDGSKHGEKEVPYQQIELTQDPEIIDKYRRGFGIYG